MKFNVEIKGLCPLLQHRFNEDTLITPKKKTGDKRLTEAEKIEVAKQYLYTDGKGKVCQPASHIEGTLIKASTQFKMVGAGKKSYKEIAKGGIFVFPEMIIHKNQKWTVDSRSIVNPTTRGRSMCYRPRIESWSLEFVIEVNDDRADEQVIKQMLEHAGSYIGIGAYRPRFGRFEVTKFQKVK
jgi:hypothetical protein